MKLLIFAALALAAPLTSPGGLLQLAAVLVLAVLALHRSPAPEPERVLVPVVDLPATLAYALHLAGVSRPPRIIELPDAELLHYLFKNHEVV